MLPKYVVDSQMGENEVYETVGKFAEITVNIYFRHSSVHCDIEMFFPQHFLLPSRHYIFDKILNSLIIAVMHHVSICN